MSLFLVLLIRVQFEHAFRRCERAFGYGFSDVAILLPLFFLAYPTRTSNANDQVLSAASAAKETVARQSQATVNDIQGLHASTQQTGNGPTAHPLAKYHSFRIPSV